MCCFGNHPIARPPPGRVLVRMRDRDSGPIVRNQLCNLCVEVKIREVAGINRCEIKRQPMLSAQQIHCCRKPGPPDMIPD